MITPSEILADTKAKYGTAEYWKDQYMCILKHYTNTAERLDKITSEQANNVTRRGNDIVHEWIAPIPVGPKQATSSELDIYSTHWGRQVHAWVNSKVRITKYLTPDTTDKMAYQIAVPGLSQYIHLKDETVRKLIPALKTLVADTSIEKNIAKGAIIMNLRTGEVIDR